MNLLQKNLYEMLKEIDDICRKNDIEYYLGGGAALGAVRHQGFLPWDDDIDLYITRSNWVKLEKILNSLQSENRSIVTMNNSEYYCNPLPRYVNNNTTLAYEPQLLCGKSLGQHIEIFIMDPMPTDPKEFEEYKKNLLIYTELITPYFVINRGVINPDSYFDYNLYNYYYKMSKKIGLDKTLQKLEDKLFKYSEEEAEYFCMRWGIKFYIYGKKMLGTPKLHKFENDFFYIPEHTEELLRVAYGDTWMYIPELSDQITHDSYQNLNTPFKTYVSKYMKKINREKVFNAYKKNKRRLMKTLIKRESYVKNRLEIKRLFLEEDFVLGMKDNETKLKLALKNEDCIILDKFYNQINDFLFSDSSKKYTKIVNLKEDFLYPYFCSLLIKGDYSKVLSLKKRYEINEYEFKNTSTKEIFNVANCFRNVSMYVYDYKQYEEAQTELSKIDDKFKNNIVYKRFFYIIQVELCKNNFNKLKDLIDKLSIDIMTTQDGELYKLLGDCYFYIDAKITANEFYKIAYEKTRNGIMLLDIYIKTGNKDYMVVK